MAKDNRASAARRGYGTDWRRLRETIPPADCACGRRWHGGFHLDHILARSKGGDDHPVNLRWTCRPCHSAKTVQADGGFGNPVRPVEAPRPARRGVDASGRPLDPSHPWHRPAR